MTPPLNLAPGDQVVYPKHGPGIVRALTERAVGGERRPYYDIQLRAGGMQVLVPVDKASALGLRRILSEEEIPALLALLGGPDVELPAAFPPRYRMEQALLEAGNVLDLARLAGTLARRHLQRGLASSELTLLTQAKKTLMVELAVALDVPESEATRLLNERLP